MLIRVLDEHLAYLVSMLPLACTMHAKRVMTIPNVLRTYQISTMLTRCVMQVLDNAKALVGASFIDEFVMRFEDL